MTWVIPQPDDLADQAASVYEAGFPGCDARSGLSLLSVSARLFAMGVFDAELFQARLAQELMPDTAVDWLYRHAAIWNVPQEQPVAASGFLSISAPSGFPVPSGLMLAAPNGVVVQTTAVVDAGVGNIAVVPVVAVVAGSAGNLAAGTVMTTVSPLAGLSAQTAPVNSAGISTQPTAGLTGGLDLEGVDSWRSRILAAIRTPAAGGASADYQAWVREVLPGAYVSVVRGWVGAGSVGVIVAAPGPLVCSGAQITAIQNYLNVEAPVTAEVVVVAASLWPVDVTLTLSPDSINNQTNALSALAQFFVGDAAIGGTIFVSRLDNAVSSASGEYSHERTLPAADQTAGNTQIPVLGTVTWG
jgi:uncharacterized phage protein gp47/JayE